MPYLCSGSGITRALNVDPQIDFITDRDGCLVTAMVHQKTEISSKIVSLDADGLSKSSEKSSEKILLLLKAAPELGAREIV